MCRVEGVVLFIGESSRMKEGEGDGFGGAFMDSYRKTPASDPKLNPKPEALNPSPTSRFGVGLNLQGFGSGTWTSRLVRCRIWGYIWV